MAFVLVLGQRTTHVRTHTLTWYVRDFENKRAHGYNLCRLATVYYGNRYTTYSVDVYNYIDVLYI